MPGRYSRGGSCRGDDEHGCRPPFAVPDGPVSAVPAAPANLDRLVDAVRARPASAPTGSSEAARRRVRLSPSGRPVPRGFPLPSTTLVVARSGGTPWAVPMTQADPGLLTYGQSMETWWEPAAPRSRGELHLDEPEQHDALATTRHVLARPCRLVWGRPGLTPRSHVPSWICVDDTGRASLVDVLTADALATTPLPPIAEMAWLCAERDWDYTVITAADPSLDRERLAGAVLDSPDGLVSADLFAAAVLNQPLHRLIAAISEPYDVVVLLPLVRDMHAERVWLLSQDRIELD